MTPRAKRWRCAFPGVTCALPAAAILALSAGDVRSAVRIAELPMRTAVGAVQRSDTTVIRVTAPVHPGVGRLVEELSIGGLDGPELYSFGSVEDVEIGPNESMYVADEVTPAIRQYDRNGKYVRTLGRRGIGPGEFGAARQGLGRALAVGPRAIAVAGDGRIAAHAPNGRRIIVYSAAGEPLITRDERFLFYAYWGHSGDAPAMLYTTGDILYIRLQLRDPNYARTALRPRPPGHYMRWRLDGTTIDTLLEPIAPSDAPIVYTGRKNAPSRHRELPFASTFEWSLSPRGYFVTGAPINRQGSYSVELRIPRGPASSSAPPVWRPGDPVTSIRVPYTPVEVQPAERRDYRDALTSYIRELDRFWRWNGPDIVSVKAPYKALWVDGDGRIWVALHTRAVEKMSAVRDLRLPNTEFRNPFWASYRWPEPPIYDVIEPSGRYLGTVQTPEGVHITAARGDRVWALIQTDDGRLTVKRYRIDWSATPASP